MLPRAVQALNRIPASFKSCSETSTKKRQSAGEMDSSVVKTALPEDLIQVPEPTWQLSLSVTPVPRLLTPSHRQAYKQNTNEHKIKINNIYVCTYVCVYVYVYIYII